MDDDGLRSARSDFPSRGRTSTRHLQWIRPCRPTSDRLQLLHAGRILAGQLDPPLASGFTWSGLSGSCTTHPALAAVVAQRACMSSDDDRPDALLIRAYRSSSAPDERSWTYSGFSLRQRLTLRTALAVAVVSRRACRSQSLIAVALTAHLGVESNSPGYAHVEHSEAVFAIPSYAALRSPCCCRSPRTASLTRSTSTIGSMRYRLDREVNSPARHPCGEVGNDVRHIRPAFLIGLDARRNRACRIAHVGYRLNR